MKYHPAWLLIHAFVLMPSTIEAAEPITLATVEEPAEIAADEPYATEFSLERAARSLDAAALNWQKTHGCTSCHTMFPYLMARGALDALWPQSREVRSFFDEIVEGKREAMPAYSCHDVEGAVAVGLAWSMALNDRWTVGKLDPLARQALDRMWTLQRDDGSWQWPFRDTPPLKVREHYGVTLAAIAAGMAPDGYAQTPAAKAGLEGIRKYLCATHPISMHEKAMLLWASVYVDRLLTREAQEQITRDLMSAQRPDGGWSVASLVDNTDDPSLARSAEALKLKAEPGYGTQFLIYAGRDGVYKSSLVPDGYATGLVIFVARQVGLPAADEKLGRGIAWLKSHQRQSGRWFTPSQSWHTQNLISNAGSAYAILALEACQDPSKP